MFFMRFVFNSRTPQKAQYDNLREKKNTTGKARRAMNERNGTGKRS